jgi:hypothetical protein
MYSTKLHALSENKKIISLVPRPSILYRKGIRTVERTVSGSYQK